MRWQACAGWRVVVAAAVVGAESFGAAAATPGEGDGRGWRLAVGMSGRPAVGETSARGRCVGRL
jgi:hypothetical protein